MRTEIIHSYKTGFILSEQELRRIAQSCQENATKIGVNDKLKIQTKLKDGSLVEYQHVDDLLASENGGQKSVVRLTLSCDDDHEEPKSYISVGFQDAFANAASWESVMLSVIGDSRDSVFVAAADLEDRIKKTQVASWSYIVRRPTLQMLATFLGLAASFFFIAFFISSNAVDIVDQLQTDYNSGKLRDPIQAIIEVERLKANQSMWPLYAFPIPMIIVFFIAWSLPYLVLKISRSYVFYWGDAVTSFDRTRGIVKGFWTTVVLGVLVAIFAGWVLQLFLR